MLLFGPPYLAIMLASLIALGIITVIIVAVQKTISGIKSDFEKGAAKRQALKNKIKTRKKSDKIILPEVAERDPAILAEEIRKAIKVGNAGKWLFISWHILPPWIRFIGCLPLSFGFVYVFFKITNPIFQGALTFGLLGVLKYVAQFIIVCVMHTIIYLLISRYRLWVSIAVAFFLTIVAPIWLWFSMSAFIESILPDILYICVLHIIVIAFLRMVWLRHDYAAAATIKLLALEFIGAGVCIIIIGIFTLFTVPLLDMPPDKILAFPIYHAYEPIMHQLMALLHLHIGDFSTETITLLFLLFGSGAMLFYLGVYMVAADYSDLPKPDNA